MAIFRAGKRIGNMDIRIGLPRDKSLVNVEGDPRITKHRPGGNPSTSIGRFMAEINKGEGVAKSNRFLIRLYPPVGKIVKDNRGGFGDESTTGGPNSLETNEMITNVNLMCSEVKFPMRNILSTNFPVYGPGRKMPYAYSYSGSLEAVFMADKFLRQRAFFENWQNKIYDKHTHNMNYYDSYVGTMDIYQLGQYRESTNEYPNDNHRITYAVRLHEVYPDNVGEIALMSLAEDQMPMPVPITFAFRTWENLTLEQVAKAELGKSVPDMPNIKPSKNYGIFGGILAKLPPEIKRAGKQVIDKIKRDFPIGRTTGGRVFPPFF